MIVQIEFTYSLPDRIRELSEEQWAELRTHPVFADCPAVRDGEPDYKLRPTSMTTIADADDIAFFERFGLRFDIRRVKGVRYPGKEALTAVPQIAVVSVPNIALYEVNEVKLLDNACTDLLQKHLDDGWRILAVCPPNDQRRPDYILGRKMRGPDS